MTSSTTTGGGTQLNLKRVVAMTAALCMAIVPAAAAKQRLAANVEREATVPAPAGIGANFKRIDGRQYMFATGSAGLYVYDTTRADAPRPVSALPLPHYENEDVSLGGNRLLISGDGTMGGGVLQIVDISNPQVPRLEHVVKMYTLGGPGHTATCIQGCDYVWVAGYGTIYVLDLTKLKDAPAPVTGLSAGTSYGIEAGDMKTHREFGWSTHDVQVDDAGIAWVVGGDGTIAFDVNEGAYGPDNLKDPVVVARTGPNAVADTDLDTLPYSNGRGDTVNDFIHHNSWRPDARRFRPRTARQLGDRSVRDGELVLITEEDIWSRETAASTPGGCESQGSFQTWQVKQFGSPGPDTGTVEHLDSWTTEFNELVANDESPLTGNDVIPTKGFCSSHYFSERDEVVATAWYEQGIRFLDVSNPRDIEQSAYYLPEGATMWAAYWAPNDRDVVYAVDNSRGVIDVLRYQRGRARRGGDVDAPLARHWFDGRRNAVKHAKFGWVCRLPRS
jgi:hypothetical protein